MLYFSKIQDDSYRIIAPISCIMASFHKLNQTDIVGCVGGALHEAETDEAVLLSGGFTKTIPSLLTGLGSALHTSDTSTGKFMVWPANAL